MAEAVTLEVQTRDPGKNKGTGSRVSRRLRAQGRVPAILYGHKQEPTPLSLTREDVETLLKKGHHLTKLNFGGQSELALVRDIQWDHLGREVLHLDFFRVSAGERITTEVALELHGTPVGLSQGGMIEQPVHTLAISCDATNVPDAIRVDVDALELGKSVHVKELKLPAGVTTAVDPELVVVHVVAKKAAEAAETTTGSAEPEVIARGKEEKKEG